MKQKRSRDLIEKTENGSEGKTSAQRESVFCPNAPTENGSRVREERLTGGSHPSGLKTPMELAGARRLRWSPALNHGEAGRSEGTKRFGVFFHVGGWWTWPSESTTSMATLSPADDGSGDGGELRWCAANFELKRGPEGGMH